jgi:hypothetical protein
MKRKSSGSFQKSKVLFEKSQKRAREEPEKSQIIRALLKRAWALFEY